MVPADMMVRSPIKKNGPLGALWYVPREVGRHRDRHRVDTVTDTAYAPRDGTGGRVHPNSFTGYDPEVSVRRPSEDYSVLLLSLIHI